MQEIDNMVQRIRELIVYASNDTQDFDNGGGAAADPLQGDRQKIQDEINTLMWEIASMADRVEFNKKKLINGDFAIGASAMSEGQQLSAAVGQANAAMAAASAAVVLNSTLLATASTAQASAMTVATSALSAAFTASNVAWSSLSHAGTELSFATTLSGLFTQLSANTVPGGFDIIMGEMRGLINTIGQGSGDEFTAFANSLRTVLNGAAFDTLKDAQTDHAKYHANTAVLSAA
jgi:flagellin-like hook-associated protein FlgL